MKGKSLDDVPFGDEHHKSLELRDQMIRAANVEIQNLREQIVHGFYEEFYPVYAQGTAGEHELTSPITADEANTFVATVKLMQAILRETLEKGLIYWEPNTIRGHQSKADMCARIERMLPPECVRPLLDAERAVIDAAMAALDTPGWPTALYEACAKLQEARHL